MQLYGPEITWWLHKQSEWPPFSSFRLKETETCSQNTIYPSIHQLYCEGLEPVWLSAACSLNRPPQTCNLKQPHTLILSGVANQPSSYACPWTVEGSQRTHEAQEEHKTLHSMLQNSKKWKIINNGEQLRKLSPSHMCFCLSRAYKSQTSIIQLQIHKAICWEFTYPKRHSENHYTGSQLIWCFAEYIQYSLCRAVCPHVGLLMSRACLYLLYETT